MDLAGFVTVATVGAFEVSDKIHRGIQAITRVKSSVGVGLSSTLVVVLGGFTLQDEDDDEDENEDKCGAK
jgi:hypothetical protein